MLGVALLPAGRANVTAEWGTQDGEAGRVRFAVDEWEEWTDWEGVGSRAFELGTPERAP